MGIVLLTLSKAELWMESMLSDTELITLVMTVYYCYYDNYYSIMSIRYVVLFITGSFHYSLWNQGGIKT